MVISLLKQSDQEASGSISWVEAVANETLQGTKGLLGRVGALMKHKLKAQCHMQNNTTHAGQTKLPLMLDQLC